jgi:hypothetical protein
VFHSRLCLLTPASVSVVEFLVCEVSVSSSVELKISLPDAPLRDLSTRWEPGKYVSEEFLSTLCTVSYCNTHCYYHLSISQ